MHFLRWFMPIWCDHIAKRHLQLTFHILIKRFFALFHFRFLFDLLVFFFCNPLVTF